MTLQSADLDRLEQLAREAQEAVDEGWTGGPPITRLRAYLAPAVVSELVAAARLGAAWQEAEAALPEGWSVRFELSKQPDYIGWWVSANGPMHELLQGARGPTPAAALVALAEALRGRTG